MDKVSLDHGNLRGKNYSTMQVFGSCPANVTCVDRRAAYVVIIRPDGRIAAIQGDRTEKFWLPGGGCEPSETSDQTAIREVREETGLAVSDLQELRSVVQYFYATSERQWYKMTASFFVCRLGEPESDSCNAQVHWLRSPFANGSFYHDCHLWAIDFARALISR